MEGGSASGKRDETEGDNKSLLRFTLRFYPLSSKFRLRFILPLPPKEEANFAIFPPLQRMNLSPKEEASIKKTAIFMLAVFFFGEKKFFCHTF